MKLNNRFSNEDKIRVWADHPYCVICNSNQNCSLHHIDGCKKDYHRSIFNSVMLCFTHHKEADGHNTNSEASRAYRDNLKSITSSIASEAGYTSTTKYDCAFLKS